MRSDATNGWLRHLSLGYTHNKIVHLGANDPAHGTMPDQVSCHVWPVSLERDACCWAQKRYIFIIHKAFYKYYRFRLDGDDFFLLDKNGQTVLQSKKVK